MSPRAGIVSSGEEHAVPIRGLVESVAENAKVQIGGTAKIRETPV